MANLLGEEQVYGLVTKLSSRISLILNCSTTLCLLHGFSLNWNCQSHSQPKGQILY